MALAAIKRDQTLAQLAQKYDVHQNQITDWKNQFLANAAIAFGAEKAEPGVNLKDLHAKIWQLALENDFLEDPLIRIYHGSS